MPSTFAPSPRVHLIPTTPPHLTESCHPLLPPLCHFCSPPGFCPLCCPSLLSPSLLLSFSTPPLHFCPALPLCFSPPSLFWPSSSSSMFMVESLLFMGIYLLALCSKPHCSWLNHRCHVHPPDLLYLGLICQFWAASSHPY